MMTDNETKRAKRARARCYDLLSMTVVLPTSGALLFYTNDPGVPLRSTPGFMLSPRFAGSIETLQETCSEFPEFVGLHLLDLHQKAFELRRISIRIYGRG
jgi:hypothetical protein